MRRSVLAAGVALLALAGGVTGQSFRNTPATYNADGSHTTSIDPCTDITVQNWADVPANRWTVDPHFDEGLPADYASLWNGRDSEFLFPNGFRKGQVFEDNNPPFCFNVPNTKNRQVQVMLQTVDPQSALCIKDITVNTRATGGLDSCFSGRRTACFGAQSDTSKLQLMVYVPSSGGATTATAFWYRVRVSGDPSSITEAARQDSARSSLEAWCAMQDQNVDMMKYPADLRSAVLPAYVARVAVEEPSAASRVTPLAMAAALLGAIGAAFARFH